MNDKQEEEVSSFTRDIKDFLRKKDFASAIILLEDLTRYIKLMKMNYSNKNK